LKNPAVEEELESNIKTTRSFQSSVVIYQSTRYIVLSSNTVRTSGVKQKFLSEY